MVKILIQKNLKKKKKTTRENLFLKISITLFLLFKYISHTFDNTKPSNLFIFKS